MKRIVFFMLLLVSSASNAVQVSNLYSAVVQLPANLSDKELLDQAFSSAVDEVLARVSGQPSELSSGVLQLAHGSAAKWVAQHSVQDVPELVMFADGAQPAKEVNVTFYKESIDGFLYEKQLPVWGSNRPSILVWLVQEQNGARILYGANQPSTTLTSFFDTAKRLGLPVYAPLVDNIDKSSLSAGALWGFFEDDISNASKRYQTDVVLAVRISHYNGSVVADGMLLSPNQDSRMESVTRDSQTEAVKALLSRFSAILSDRYASVRTPGDPKEVFVKVDGVSNYRSMSEVKNYLGSIAVVRQLQLRSIIGDSVEFGVYLDGTADKFKNTVALNSVLAAKPISALDPDANRVELFEYKGKGVN